MYAYKEENDWSSDMPGTYQLKVFPMERGSVWLDLKKS